MNWFQKIYRFVVGNRSVEHSHTASDGMNTVDVLIPLMPKVNPVLLRSEAASQTNELADGLRKAMVTFSPASEHEFLIAFIDSYDMLRKCYVVARKNVINETLNKLFIAINDLILLVGNNEVDKNKMFSCLQNIFNEIESIRFSTHRDGRCSKNLFERSKQVKLRLRKACFSHSVAHEFVEIFSLHRESLIKDKRIS